MTVMTWNMPAVDGLTVDDIEDMPETYGQSLEALEDAAHACEVAEASGYRYALAVSLQQQYRAFVSLGRENEAVEAGLRSKQAFTELRGAFVDPLISR